jgi:glycine betaine/proline transport system ATP-binding protein
MSTQAETSTSLEPVIRCDSVYMIFGDNAHSMLEQANGVVDHAKFHEAGCIVGVNNASFEVHKGELLIIMGLSGSGKSTLMRCISRLNEATAGKIYIDGEDILAMNDKQLIELRRNKMGMVFQSFALLPHKTVLRAGKYRLPAAGQGSQHPGKHATRQGNG